jgi:plasmid stability protein
MSKMIQVRNVPDELHRTLRVRAADAVRAERERR